MEFIMRELRRTDSYNRALELYFFSKGLACDIMDGGEEGAPGVLEMIKCAGKKGLEWMMEALEGVDDASRIILEIFQRAVETGRGWMDIATEMLAAYWGFRSGGGEASESGVGETELVEMVTDHSPCPTE